MRMYWHACIHVASQLASYLARPCGSCHTFRVTAIRFGSSWLTNKLVQWSLQHQFCPSKYCTEMNSLVASSSSSSSELLRLLDHRRSHLKKEFWEPHFSEKIGDLKFGRKGSAPRINRDLCRGPWLRAFFFSLKSTVPRSV